MDEVLTRLLEFLRHEEGCSLKAYRDAMGWAIGYGHQCPEGTAPISAERAEELLLQDAQAALSKVDDVPGLADNERVALASLVFNIGCGAFMQSTLRKKLIEGDMEGAAAEFDKWVYVTAGDKKIVSQTLKARRARERAIFEETYSDGAGKMLEKFLTRMKEASTWRGIGGLVVTAGLASMGQVDAIIAVGTAILSAVEVFRSEQKK
jgi:lysozyme